MSKYTADIEIAVRGGREVDTLIKGLNRLNNSINVVNRNAKLLQGKGFNVASLENYTRAVYKAERAVRAAAQGTKQEAQAVENLVTAIDKENAARARRNFLIAQEVAKRRQVIATANAGFGVQGPQAASIRAGRGPASPLRGTVNMPGSPAALAAGQGQTRGSRAGIGSRLGGAVSGSIIGGAFPLLFGQGGGAAAGGAIGGLVGGLAGPGGSFAGSLLGTLLGDIASRGQAVKQLGEDIGFSAAQTKTLADAFKVANTDVEKFTAVVQNIRGVGLELEEQATAVQLITTLTEKYGGTFEKVGNAITSALESGKVSQAVLNQLTGQGITVQDALAAKYDVSRDKILDMAKKGEISVQSLLDVLVELGNASTTAAEKTQTPFEKALSTTTQLFQSFWKEVQTIFSGISSSGVDAATGLLNVFNKLLQEVLFPLGRLLARISALFIDVVSTGVRAATDLINGFRGVASAVGDTLMGIVNMIPGLRTIVGLARQLFKGVTGPKSSDWNDMPWPEGIPKPGSAGMIGNITAPSQAFATGGRGTRGTASNEAERLAREIERSLESGRQLATQFSRQVLLLTETNELERKRLQIQFDYEDRAKQIGELKNAEQKINLAQLNDEIRRLQIIDLQTEAIKQQAEEARKLFADALNNVSFGVSSGGPVADMVSEMDQALTDFVSPLNAVLTAAEAIGTAFSTSFRDIITGAKSAQQAIADFFQKIGQALIDYATTAIAQYIAIGIARIFAGINSLSQANQNLSGTGALAQPSAVPSLNVGGIGGADVAGNFTPNLFNAGAAGLPSGGFAAGGFVTGPTRALIGEGGEPEYVIPASKMRGAMSRYAAGTRGSAVIPAGGDGGTEEGGTATMAPAAIDVRYTVERINNVDYVTADQFQRGMQQAAAQGAQRGQQLTLRRLQQSPSTRRRVGI